VLIVDNHIKRCSEKISNLLDDSYNVTGITKQNADLEAITLSIDVNVDSYTKDDILILSDGTMNVARNETNNCLRHLTHFLKRTCSTIVLILKVPHCLDLVNSSCVNKESIVYIRKLQKIVKTSNHVWIQNMSRDRTCNTKHGMHMNSLGKNWMCQEITKKILDLLSPKSDNLHITLDLKVPHSTDTTPQYSSNSTVCSLVMNRRPLREKTPTTRNEDFFMGLSQLSSVKTKRNSQTALHIFQQNIWGFRHKMDELMCMLDSFVLSPHIICLLEHYLVDHKLLMIKPINY